MNQLLMPCQKNLPSKFAAHLLNLYPEEEIQRLVQSRGLQYRKYQQDPVGFGEDILRSFYTEDIKKLMLSVRDYTVTIAKSSTGVGKTFAAADLALWYFLTYSDSQIYTAAAPPESNLKKLLWGEIGERIVKNTNIFSPFKVTTMNIERHSNSFITGVCIPSSGTDAEREARFNGKHAPHLMFIIDEGDAVPEEVYSGIEACMSGGHIRLLILFNPRAQSGPIYRMERDGLANVVTLEAFNHPNVVTGEDIIPGAVSRSVTAQRIAQMSRPLMPGEVKDDNCFEVPDYFDGVIPVDQNNNSLPILKGLEIRKVKKPGMAYKVLARYPTQSESQLISREWITAARIRWDEYVKKHGEVPPRDIQPIQGLDVAEFGSDQNVSCLRYEWWLPQMDAWDGVDTMITGDRAIKIAQEKNVKYTNVDGTGVGAGVAPHMEREGVASNSIKVGSGATEEAEEDQFCGLRDQIYMAVANWLETDPNATLPPNEMLQEEMLSITYENTNRGIKMIDKKHLRKTLKRSPDYFDALSLTFAPDASGTGFGGFI